MTELVYPSSPAPVYPRPSAGNPGVRRRFSGEMLPLVTPDGQVYGQASREWIHGRADVLHPVVHLYLLDRYRRFYLQRRSMTKSLYPGLWDTSVGGHVTYGEGLAEALFREASEEIGLSAFNPILMGSYINEAESEKEYSAVYAVIGHPELHPDGQEVSEGRWWTVPEIEASLGSNVFTPSFEKEFTELKDKLLALL